MVTSGVASKDRAEIIVKLTLALFSWICFDWFGKHFLIYRWTSTMLQLILSWCIINVGSMNIIFQSRKECIELRIVSLIQFLMNIMNIIVYIIVFINHFINLLFWNSSLTLTAIMEWKISLLWILQWRKLRAAASILIVLRFPLLLLTKAVIYSSALIYLMLHYMSTLQLLWIFFLMICIYPQFVIFAEVLDVVLHELAIVNHFGLWNAYKDWLALFKLLETDLVHLICRIFICFFGWIKWAKPFLRSWALIHFVWNALNVLPSVDTFDEINIHFLVLALLVILTILIF